VTSGMESGVSRLRKRTTMAPPEVAEQPVDPGEGPSHRGPPERLQDSGTDIEMEARPQPKAKERKQKKKGTSKEVREPRRIRMMLGHTGFNVLAEFRDIPVKNLKWGELLDIAPALRRTVGTGLLLEPLPKKRKGKQPAESVEAAVVNARFKKDLEEGPCLNFFTKAVVHASNRMFEIEKALIDAGSVVNLASQSILETIGAPLYPVFDLTIRTATSALTTIRYYTEVDVSVAGVLARIRVYAIPREFNLSYGLLLSRRWMRQVKMRGNYELDTYYLKDGKGKYREVPRNTVSNVNAVEWPCVRLTGSDSGTESSMDDETRNELELAEASSEPGGDEVLREVIGQATDVMRRQLRQDNPTDASEPESDSSSGNAFGF